jgi:hypothetical protein
LAKLRCRADRLWRDRRRPSAATKSRKLSASDPLQFGCAHGRVLLTLAAPRIILSEARATALVWAFLLPQASFGNEVADRAVLNENPANFRSHENRRGRRINARIPVAFEWTAADGERFQAEAHTRVLNYHGCLIVAPCDLAMDTRMKLTNLANNRNLIAVVVWKGKQRVEGYEMGIELVNPDLDFWGLDL